MGAFKVMQLVKPFRFLRNVCSADRVGIDASMLIHHLLSVHAEAIVSGEDWTTFDRDMANRLEFLHANSEYLIVVFDGVRPKAKIAASSRRIGQEKALDAIPALTELQAQLTEELARTVDAEARSSVAGSARCASTPTAASSSSQAVSDAEESLDKVKADLRRNTRKGVHKKVTDAEHRTVAICQILRIDYVVSPGEAETQLASLQRQGHIEWIICNDADYLTLECDNLMFECDFNSRPVQSFTWEHAESLLQAGTRPNAKATASQDYSDTFTEAMKAFGPQLVCRIASYFLRNDYGSGGIGLDKLSKGLRAVIRQSRSVPVLTVELMARKLVDITKKPFKQIALVAERAAFMYHGQPVFHVHWPASANSDSSSEYSVKLVVPPLPRECAGCKAALFARGNESAAELVTELTRKFKAMSNDKLLSWARASDRQLPEVKLNVPTDHLDLSCLDRPALVELAARLKVAVGTASEEGTAGLRERLVMVYKTFSDGRLRDDAVKDLFDDRLATAINLSKKRETDAWRRSLEDASMQDFNIDGLEDAPWFVPKSTVNRYMNIVPSSRREELGPMRTVKSVKVGCMPDNDSIGFITGFSQASLPPTYSYEVAIKVELEGTTVSKVLDAECLLHKGVVDSTGKQIKANHKFCRGASGVSTSML